MNNPNEVIFLALAVLLGAVLALGAVALGLWFAGRLTGVLGKPMQVIDPMSASRVAGFHDQTPGDYVEPESVPWIGGDGDPDAPLEGVDLGEDPDNWKSVPS